jgi:hypothetical protein
MLDHADKEYFHHCRKFSWTTVLLVFIIWKSSSPPPPLQLNMLRSWLDGMSNSVDDLLGLEAQDFLLSKTEVIGKAKEKPGGQESVKNSLVAGCQWLTPVILATQGAEIRRIKV